jgi:hypothetical protein
MISSKIYSPVIFENQDPARLRKGTSAYHRFWEEQFQRCINGYTPTGGTFIPGNYYFYLNFCKIRLFDEDSNRKEIGAPIYRDLDHEYFLLVDKAQKEGFGVIVLKGRRKGFSFMNANLLLHEWSFFPQSECGMGAQKEKYVSDFYNKLLLTYNNISPQFRNNYLLQNKDIFTSGWKEKENGIWIEKGLGSLLYFRLIQKPDEFRGTSLKKWIVDEAGEVTDLKQVLLSTEECFKEGSHQFGVPIIGGTSNKMSHDSEDFMELWYKHEEYNLRQFFVSAAVLRYPFFNKETGKSDIEAGTKDIMKMRADKAEDLKALMTFKQEQPLTPEDAFIVFGSTPFDLEKINKRITVLNTNKNERIWRTGKLEWPVDKNGKSVFGGKPEFKVDKAGPMKILHTPIIGVKNAHVSAVDPYHVSDDLEEDKGKQVSKKGSKGCMYVHRRFIDMNTVGNLPVFEYYDRPYSKEDFYENCLKICIFYDTQVLVEYNDDGFLKYFINKGFGRFLMLRPKSADAPYSQATNRYGIHMKEYQKSLLVELVDEYIKSDVENIYFLGLLKELSVFGTKNTDRVSAFGMCLIANMETKTRVRNTSEEEEQDLLNNLPRYESAGGVITLQNAASGSDDFNINSLFEGIQ